jgi:hypothetical protein
VPLAVPASIWPLSRDRARVLQSAALRRLAGKTLTSKLGAIAASVAAVEQAAKPILDNVRPTCPSMPSAEPPSGS